MVKFQSVLLCTLYSFIYVTRAHVILNGSNFTSGSTPDYFRNYILSCDDNYDCSISCSSINACFNTTIVCPINGACTVLCSNSFSCYYTDIHWIQGNENTLTIHPNIAYRVNHPPSSADNTSLVINCPGHFECEGSIITCPHDAQCQVLCTGTSSCAESIIHCPTTSICDVLCTGTDACNLALVYWSFDPLVINSSMLSCPEGATQCDLIQPPSIIHPPNNNDTYNLTCDGDKQCASATINCPLNGDCRINCQGYGSCAGSIIECPRDRDCEIVCTGQYSCYGSIINGETYTNLDISCGDEQSNSCKDLIVNEPTPFPTQEPTGLYDLYCLTHFQCKFNLLIYHENNTIFIQIHAAQWIVVMVYTVMERSIVMMDNVIQQQILLVVVIHFFVLKMKNHIYV